jgi:hypothetical protein
MSPQDLAKPNTEHAHQVALFCWCSQNTITYPDLSKLFAIPNGGERNIIVAARLKAEGVKSGVSDLMLPVARQGFHGLFIEMKKPGKLKSESANQKAFGTQVQLDGYLYRCCDSWELAAETLTWYLQK